MKLIKSLTSIKSMVNYSDPDLEEITPEQLKKLQETLTEMMMDIIHVCEENHIDIFLLGGSSLGSVRHKGFIPWDDDIDLGMTREAYEKFVPVFEKELSDRYILNAPNYSRKVLYRFPKILKKDSYMDTGATDDPEFCKVFVDIFIADHIPDNKLHKYLKGTLCNCLEFISNQVAMNEYMDEDTKQRLRECSPSGFVLRKAVGKLFSFRSASYWYGKVDKACQYKKKSTQSGLPTGSKHYFGEIFPETVFLPVTYGEFEGHRVPLLHEPDVYLKNLYGDYMQIPPEEKRQKHFVRTLKL